MSTPLVQTIDIPDDLAPSVTFTEGERIFEVGSVGDCCFFIEEGVVQVKLDRADLDDTAVLAHVEAGQILGELALLDQQPRAASAYALTEVRARMLTATALDEVTRQKPEVAVNLFRRMGRNAALSLRASSDSVASLAFTSRDDLVEELVARAARAQPAMLKKSEKEIDALLLDLADRVGRRARHHAELTVSVTGIGNVDDKATKNRVGSLGVLKTLHGERGGGFVDPSDTDVRRIVAPVGVVFGLIPVTSSVATSIFKILIALKGRNAIILSPHRAAIAACRDLMTDVCEVLVDHGFPEDAVVWVTERSDRRRTAAFMRHKGVQLILATGGRGMVEAAYRSGTPAYGVGPGNAPVLVDETVDPDAVASRVIRGKSFDNGLVCGSENNLVVVREIVDAFVEGLIRHGAAILDPDEVERFRAAALDDSGRHLDPKVAGQSAARIARAVGIKRPYGIRLIVVPTEDPSPSNAFAREKLAPILSLFVVDDFDAGIELSQQLLATDGTGHTASIHSAIRARLERYALAMPVSRIIANSAATYGIVGVTTSLDPSFSLGCGTFGGTSSTDNIGYKHLLNVKRLAMHDQDKETMLDFMDFVNPTGGLMSQLLGFDALEVEAEGCIVRDSRGREFLDCLAGVGVMNLGHRHPVVINAVKEQLDKMPLSSRLLFNGRQAELGRALAEIAPGRSLRYSFFCNSGTEAVEAALKLARAATGRPRIVGTINGYHGKTMGSLSASGRDVFKKPFGQLVPGFDHVPFGDADALAAAMGDDVAAVILEPVQGEGGVRVPPQGYLKRAREICDAHGAMLILDEVQTGFGRCGRMFACELEGVVPDLLCLAKGLSGGVIPIGAVMGTTKAWQIFEDNPFMHSSTFGGNPLACAAGLATIRVIREEGLCERAVERGAQLMGRLQAIRAAYPDTLLDVRGIGLLIGVEFSDEDFGAHVLKGMADRGVIAAYTLNQPKVIRFEPPLIITEEQCDRAADAFEAALIDELS